VTTQAHDDTSPALYVTRTVEDQSYWENWVQSKKNYFIEGPFLVEKVASQTDEGITGEIETKRDWKTGWIMYQCWKSYNNSILIFHYEFCVLSYEPFSSRSTSHLTYNSHILMMLMSIVIIVFGKNKTKFN